MIAKCPCEHCDENIEFATEEFLSGGSVVCPHCGMETTLYVSVPPSAPKVGILVPATPPPQQFTAPGAAYQQKPSMKFLPWIIVALLVGVVAFAAYKWQQGKVSRRNVLQALMEVQSATAIGVSPMRYGELITKADATLNLEKTTLSGFGNKQFLSCAENSMHFYREANTGWRDGQALWGYISEQDFKDFQSAGVNITPTDYPPNPPEYVKMVEELGSTVEQSNPQHDSPVPLNEWLSLNWKAADFYIEKMK